MNESFTYESFSPEDTANMGFMLGQEAKRGDIFCLCGDLGAGKTVFTQGFAQGIGYTDQVTSPTFTLMNVYEGGRLPVYHFDLYRLEGDSDLESIGYEDYFFSGGVSLVEWPERAGDAIPQNAIWIKIRSDFARDAEYREIIFDGGMESS